MRVCVSLIEQGVKEAVAAGLKAQELGADLIEVRFDQMAKLPEDLSLFRKITVPKIATLRPVDQGGSSTHSDEERARFFRRAARIGFQYLDIELNSPLSSQIGRELRDVKIICSYHDLEGTPEVMRIIELLVSASSRGHLAKVAFKINDISELSRLVEASRLFSASGERHIIIGMGALGEITRVRSKDFGNDFTYASLEPGKESAPGQLDVSTLKALGERAMVTGLTGFPLGHSYSPAMHDLAFKEVNMPGKYLLFPAQSDELESLMDIMRALHLRGMNVTIPHKESIIPYLDALDPIAKRVGAVNTIVNEKGQLTGKNTDVTGLEQALLAAGADPVGKKVLVIGAGGAARACCGMLERRKADIWVTNRTFSHAQEVARSFNAKVVSLDDAAGMEFGMVINCTPVGMAGFSEGLPIDPKVFRPDHWAVDLIYNPTRTNFLAEAEARGAKTLSGMEMLIYQAMDAFEAWTGHRPSYEAMSAGAGKG
jgi:3-dehydroquinate dehydratase-1/3-dehydroquinate dehydratase/shikimate dehydrogenase